MIRLGHKFSFGNALVETDSLYGELREQMGWADDAPVCLVGDGGVWGATGNVLGPVYDDMMLAIKAGIK